MSLKRRGILLVVAAVAYLAGFWPSWWVRDFVLNAAHNPPYQGVWILIPHLALYSTLQTLVCLIAWTVLARMEWISALRVSLKPASFSWGLGAGLVSVAAVVAFFFVTGQAGVFHAPRVDPWNAGANIFSNFFEEYVYRGFILAALTAALGFWPAAILSSVAFGAVHSQYPLELRALIAAIAVMWAWIARRSGGLLAPYTAHMTLDWLVDPIL